MNVNENRKQNVDNQTLTTARVEMNVTEIEAISIFLAHIYMSTHFPGL